MRKSSSKLICVVRQYDTKSGGMVPYMAGFERYPYWPFRNQFFGEGYHKLPSSPSKNKTLGMKALRHGVSLTPRWTAHHQPTAESRDPSSGVSVEMLLSKLLASDETHTLHASAQWSRDWEQLCCGGIWCFCCYNHSIPFGGEFVLKEGSPTSQQSETSLLPHSNCQRFLCDADRQVIAIAVVELDEVLAIAEDAVGRLLAARNGQVSGKSIVWGTRNLADEHQSAGDHQGYWGKSQKMDIIKFQWKHHHFSKWQSFPRMLIMLSIRFEWPLAVYAPSDTPPFTQLSTHRSESTAAGTPHDPR